MEDTRENYLRGFWLWITHLAAGRFQVALDSLYWDRPTSWTADELKKRILTFFGGVDPWSVVIPNERLIDVINDAAQVELRKNGERGWLMAMIPLTTKPDDPQDDAIPLMGLATSFFVRELQGEYVLEFEIFHA
jgi:hypothetical protein